MATTEVPAPVRIRRAALQLFAAQGYAATGIREIAEVAEIPTSLLYHYRRSKEEILRDLILDGLARHLESSAQALPLARNPEEGIRVMVAVHVLVPLRNPDMARIMESEVRSLSAASQEVVGTRRAQGDERWERLLRDGVDAGVFSVADHRFTRRLLRRMCTGIWLWYSPGHPMPVDEVITQLSDHALGAVRARRGGHDVRGADLAHPGVDVLLDIVDAAHRDEVEVRPAG